MEQELYRELRDRISEGFTENQKRQGEIQTAIALADQKLDALASKSEDQEQRIRKLEGWRMKLIGIATATGAFISFILERLFGATS